MSSYRNRLNYRGDAAGDVGSKHKLKKTASSASRFFGKLKTKVFGKPLSITLEGDSSSSTVGEQCAMIPEAGDSQCGVGGQQTPLGSPRTYMCHLCSYMADRITLLDRHLLHDHKIGLDNLLQLVMSTAKNKADTAYVPYYQPEDIGKDLDLDLFDKMRANKETRTVGVNTDSGSGVTLRHSCVEITRQLEKMLSTPLEQYDQGDLLSKMAALNELVCNVIESSTNSPGAPLDPAHPVSPSRRILDLSIDDFLVS